MKNKILKISILGIGIITALTIKSKAAVQIVPTKNITVNTTVSNSFILSRGLTNKGQVLYGTSVTPNLVTNADWGAVSYLANSNYGSSGKYQNLGTDAVKVKIKDSVGKEASYYSTTGNKTGVMNWGSNPNNSYTFTQTSSLISAYVSSPTGNTNVTSLYENIDSGYVETINTKSFSKDTTRGQAFKETAGWYSGFSYITTDYPISVRNGLFGFSVGGACSYGYLWHYEASGAEYGNVTYRVVFWN